MLSIEERIYALRKLLTDVRGYASSRSLHEPVQMEAGHAIALIDGVIELAAAELFTEPELYLIWLALERSGTPADFNLRDRVQEMSKRRPA